MNVCVLPVITADLVHVIVQVFIPAMDVFVDVLVFVLVSAVHGPHLPSKDQPVFTV